MTHILNHTLANPNQCCLFDISWCDDPWDPHQKFGMTSLDLLLEIPFDTVGSTVSFITRTPTQKEFKELFDSRIIITNEMTWNPSKLVPPTRKQKCNNFKRPNSKCFHTKFFATFCSQ